MINNNGPVQDGYTLFAPQFSTNTFLIDNCGKKINEWTSNYLPGLGTYLLEDGRLLRAAKIPNGFVVGGTGGAVELYDWDGDLLWYFEFSSDSLHQHHDLAVMPNGNILLSAWEVHEKSEAIEQGANPDLIGEEGIWSERIVEIQPVFPDSGLVVWEWRAWDYLVQEFDSGKDNFGIVAEHPNRLNLNYKNSAQDPDWLHINGIDYHPERDEIILSSRSFNELWVISHSNSNAGILYRWGNPAAYNRGEIADQKFFGQHDVQWIPSGYPGAGNVLVFNNGSGRPEGNFSSIEELTPALQADGSYTAPGPGLPFGPDSVSWKFLDNPPGNFYSKTLSGAQRLQNGNTLACTGQTGTFSEFHADSLVWKYQNPIGPSGPLTQGNFPINTTVFKIRKYAPDYPAFQGRTLAPGDRIELNPLLDDCMSNTTVEIDPRYKIYPNPVVDFIRIENPSDNKLTIQVTDLLGRPVYSTIERGARIQIDTQTWNAGAYLLWISLYPKQVSRQLIIKNPGAN
ncbi:MAG: aryl-sulfate sulfotransferase [Saprospiraceae bacterium]